MPTGIVTAYDLTTGVIVDMDTAIYMVSAQDSPLLTGVDSDGLSVLGSMPTTNKKFDWMHDELLTPRSTLAATAITTAVEIVVASGHQLRFSTGDVLKLGGGASAEIVRVTGYSATTADTLLVTRSYGTVAAAQHAQNADVVSLGTALAEGSDPEDFRARDRDEFYNLTQIFGPTKVSMSRTEQIIAKYGVSNEFAYQVQKKVTENVISREQALLYGERTEDTSTKIRTTGGMWYFMTANDDSTSTQLTEATIQARQQALYNVGGSPDRLMANPISLSDLNSIGDSNRVRVEMADSRRGRVPVTVVITEFGAVTIVRNRWMLTSDALLFSRENAVRKVMTPLIMEKLAKTGDSDKMQLVTEEGLEVKGADHCGRFTNLSYTA